MKVKDLYNILSPFQNFQLGDSKTGEPLTYVNYIADSACEIDNYMDYDVYGITSKVDKEGNPYLVILLVMTV